MSAGAGAGRPPAGPGINHHASAVAIDGVGVLLRGPARSGKSALALSLLRRATSAGLSAALVADDQVLLQAVGGELIACVPAAIRGLIEVSGVGILREPCVDTALVRLVVDLLPGEAVPRLPESSETSVEGIAVRRIFLPEREAALGADIVLTVLLARPAAAARPG